MPCNKWQKSCPTTRMTFKDVSQPPHPEVLLLLRLVIPFAPPHPSPARGCQWLKTRPTAIGRRPQTKPKTKRVYCHECQNEIETETEMKMKMKTQQDVRRAGPKAAAARVLAATKCCNRNCNHTYHHTVDTPLDSCGPLVTTEPYHHTTTTTTTTHRKLGYAADSIWGAGLKSSRWSWSCQPSWIAILHERRCLGHLNSGFHIENKIRTFLR